MSKLYTPPFTITSSMLNQVSLISELEKNAPVNAGVNAPVNLDGLNIDRRGKKSFAPTTADVAEPRWGLSKYHPDGGDHAFIDWDVYFDNGLNYGIQSDDPSPPIYPSAGT